MRECADGGSSRVAPGETVLWRLALAAVGRDRLGMARPGVDVSEAGVGGALGDQCGDRSVHVRRGAGIEEQQRLPKACPEADVLPDPGVVALRGGRFGGRECVRGVCRASQHPVADREPEGGERTRGRDMPDRGRASGAFLVSGSSGVSSASRGSTPPPNLVSGAARVSQTVA